MPPSTGSLGRTRLKELDFERAAATLKRAVELDSMDAAAYVDLAQVELKRREYAAAERAARRAIALDHLVQRGVLRAGQCSQAARPP